jgi:hypothetical protein
MLIMEFGREFTTFLPLLKSVDHRNGAGREDAFSASRLLLARTLKV